MSAPTFAFGLSNDPALVPPVSVAKANLDQWLEQWKKDNVGKPTPPVVVAAALLAKALDKEAAAS